MAITIIELLQRYPLKPSRIALVFGRSREWISHQAHNTSLSVESRENNLLKIEQYLQQIGNEMITMPLCTRDIDANVTTLQNFFRTYPFTIAGLAKYMNQPREWLYQVIYRYNAKPQFRQKHISFISKNIKEIGNDLSTIELTL